MRTSVATPHSYSSAVRAGDTIYIGLHRGRGASFAAQLDDAIAALERTLAKLDGRLADLVQIHVYLKDVDDLGAMERAFAPRFPVGGYPARMTTTTRFVDDDCLVMLDGIAVAPATAAAAHIS